MNMKIKKMLVIIAIIMLIVFMSAFTSVNTWTPRQDTAHQIAELARSIGLDEGNPIIQEAQNIWWNDENAKREIDAYIAVEESAEKFEASSLYIPELPLEELYEPVAGTEQSSKWSELDLSILAKVIYGEANGCPWEHMCAVGCVVLNRVADERFPNTIYDVVAQPRQYSTSYLSGFDNIPGECWDAARTVLQGDYTIPSNVVWQAQFIQGSGIWWTSYVDTGWWKSTTYFCY